MDSLFSFPVGLFHPLQHAGLSRRSPVCRLSENWLNYSPQGCIIGNRGADVPAANGDRHTLFTA